jgi:TetR/AcrR family transcriptional regulator, tetracycline repressor protein
MIAARRTPEAGIVARRALAVLDEVGHSGFSMRRLGADLGVDPMAVYRRFADQEALFDGVAAALFDEIDVATLPWAGSWRETLEGFCRRLRDVLLAHPQAVRVYATRPVRSPAATAFGTRVLLRMAEAGIPSARALQMNRCLSEFVVGHAMALSAADDAAARSGKPEPGSEQYTVLAEAADAVGRDEHFELGLGTLLDGFEGAR